MNEKKQPKKRGFRANNKEAVKTLIDAIDECRGKPSYDYQRIIICLSAAPSLGPELARHCGVAARGPAPPLELKPAAAVVIVEPAQDCGREMVESIVFFVNQTPGVVVLLAGTESLAKWQQWPIEAGQIRRRTHLAIKMDG